LLQTCINVIIIQRDRSHEWKNWSRKINTR